MYFFFPPLSLSSTTLLSPAPPPQVSSLRLGHGAGLDLPSFLPLALSPCSEWPYAGRWQSVAPLLCLLVL